jgi:hypothetical protein
VSITPPSANNKHLAYIYKNLGFYLPSGEHHILGNGQFTRFGQPFLSLPADFCRQEMGFQFRATLHLGEIGFEC